MTETLTNLMSCVDKYDQLKDLQQQFNAIGEKQNELRISALLNMPKEPIPPSANRRQRPTPPNRDTLDTIEQEVLAELRKMKSPPFFSLLFIGCVLAIFGIIIGSSFNNGLKTIGLCLFFIGEGFVIILVALLKRLLFYRRLSRKNVDNLVNEQYSLEQEIYNEDLKQFNIIEQAYSSYEKAIAEYNNEKKALFERSETENKQTASEYSKKASEVRQQILDINDILNITIKCVPEDYQTESAIRYIFSYLSANAELSLSDAISSYNTKRVIENQNEIEKKREEANKKQQQIFIENEQRQIEREKQRDEQFAARAEQQRIEAFRLQEKLDTIISKNQQRGEQYSEADYYDQLKSAEKALENAKWNLKHTHELVKTTYVSEDRKKSEIAAAEANLNAAAMAVEILKLQK